MANEKENALSADISPTMHPLSIEPMKAVLAPEHGATYTAKAFAAGTAALKNLYESMADLESVNQLMRQKYQVGVVVDGQTGRTMHKELPDDVAAQVAADYGARFDRTARVFDQQAAIVGETIEKLQGVIDSALTHKANDPKSAAVASDIRQFVRGLPENKRMDWLHGRIGDGDVEIVSAVLASPWVAGLDKAHAATIRDLASERLAAVEFAQIATCKKLAAHLQTASAAYVSQYRRIVPRVREDNAALATKKLREG